MQLKYFLKPMQSILARGKAQFRFVAKYGSRYLELGVLKQHPPREWSQEHFPAKKSPQKLKISIVTPSFNQGAFIEETILSVLNQNYSNLEYIIQDGLSNDSTSTVLSKYQDRAIIDIRKDGGQTAALNLGFAKATGEILAYLNSDDLLSQGTLEYVNYIFNQYPDVDVIYGNRLIIDENSKLIGRWVLGGYDRDHLTKVDYVPQETMFWRRRAWDKIGAHFDESFRFAMDWELISRFIKYELKFMHLPYFLGIFRVHSAQKTTTQNEQIGHKECLRIMREFHGEKASIEMLIEALQSYAKICAVNSLALDLFNIRISKNMPRLGNLIFFWR